MRKVILVISALLLTFSSFAQRSFDRSTMDWANFGKYESANEALQSNPSVVFIGDSITENWATMRPEFFSDRGFAARGIGGQATAHILCRFQNDVVALKPKVVVILCGTNDVAKNNGFIKYENVVGQIKSMCDIAKANGIKPIVGTVPPSTKFFWVKDYQPAPDIVKMNEILLEMLKKEKITVVDYHKAMANPDGTMPESLSDDGCHPTHKGYEVMEATILPLLKKYIKK